MAEFLIGEKAVYPGHGVAEITGVESKEIGGSAHKFYVLRLLAKDITLMVPMRNADTLGLRRIVDQESVDAVFEVLRRRDAKISTATWNRRYREYMEKIRTGSLTEIGGVLRDLSLLKTNKDLSYGEKNMLETARDLLVQELALAQDRSEAEVTAELEELFKRPG